MKTETDDNALNAIVVRNILDIEAAIAHATETITDRISKELNSIFEASFDTGEWHVSEKNDFWEGWFCPQQWVFKKGKKDDAWSSFNINVAGNDIFESWLATLVAGSEETGIVGLFYRYLISKTDFLAAMNALPDAMTTIRGAGFVVDGDSIYYPLHIDRELLALGFEADDLTQAVGPFQQAADALTKAMPAFEALHSEILKSAN